MSAETFEDFSETFAFLDDWEDRYRYVIDLGKAMPPMDEALKSKLTKVDGCASQVWIAPRLEDENGPTRLYFTGDSDAMIVRGLIAVLSLLLNGRTAREVAEMDVNAKLAELDLAAHLSAQRSNGLNAMIQRLKGLAKAAA